MGQKVNPRSQRVGIVETWRSNWQLDKNTAKNIAIDYAIRKFLYKKLAAALVSDILISRFGGKTKVIIKTAKPGFVIGKGGAGIEDLRNAVIKLTKETVDLDVEEVKNANQDARILAETVRVAIEKRVSYRRAVKQAVEKSKEAGAKGIKIMVSGRLGGADMSRREVFNSGQMPLSTFRSKIDYAYVTASTTFGIIGIKVWIYTGEVFEKKKEENDFNFDAE